MTDAGMSPEEATERLRLAIVDVAVANGYADPATELLNHFAVIAHWQQVEGGDRSTYTTHFHDETVPTHIGAEMEQPGAELVARDPEGDC